MPDVIFCRPRMHYQSYTDLYRLIELAGYPLVFLDEIDPQSDNCYICTLYDNMNHPGDMAVWAKGWPGAKAKIILYDLEWHLGDNSLPAVPGLAEIWAADAYYAKLIDARYVPLGSDVRLPLTAITRNGQYEYDVATLTYNTWRRQRAIEDLQTHGLTVAPNDWGEARDRILERSRLMIHIHQLDNVPTVAPSRFAIAAAYHLPLITETLGDEGIFGKSYKLMSDFAHLGEFAAWCLHPDNAYSLQEYGETLHGLLCQQHTFKSFIEAAV